MTTQEIANRLVTLCKKGEFDTAQKELFSEDAISIEPYETPDFAKETKGLAAIEAKGKKWEESVEASYGYTVSDPIVAGNSFACTLGMDIKMKGHDRMVVSELCVYNVKDGKIVSEEFFM